MEWSSYIDEIKEKETELHTLKKEYREKETELLLNTDFKGIYGANNDKIRNNHIKKELSDEYDAIKRLEFNINEIKRTIDYIKQLVITKRVTMECECCK